MILGSYMTPTLDMDQLRYQQIRYATVGNLKCRHNFLEGGPSMIVVTKFLEPFCDFSMIFITQEQVGTEVVLNHTRTLYTAF